MKGFPLRKILPLFCLAILAVTLLSHIHAQDPATAPPEPPQWSILEDADQDGLTDWDDFLLSLDPLNPLDGLSDADGDELWLAWEWQLGTHPDLADTDGDGWSDSLEVLLYGTDPLDPASKPEGNGAGNIAEPSAELDPEQTTAPEEKPPSPSLSNGDFTDIEIQNWKISTSKSYQGGGFQWGEGTAASWSPYFGNTIEVWQANGETFVELDGNKTSYGIKQPIANARAGAFILAWKQCGRNDTKSGTNPYYVRIYHDSDKGPVVISDSQEFSDYDKHKWTDNAHVFNITPEQITAANGKPIYIAFIPTSLNTYGTLIDKVSIHTMDLIAHKRGTINKPGPAQPKGNGEYGYETVMMENADSESAAASTSRDCDVSGASADINTYRKANDDDLVKIVLKWPVGIKPAGASLKLLHEGMQVDATQTTAEKAVSISGPGRLNFYKADGTRIVDPATDLQIADLANAPRSCYLSKILTDGEVTIFIEGADRFGDLPVNRMTRLGGAQLIWQFNGRTTATEKLLVYRGGFLRFVQPAGEPGTVGDFEFWDGKGRVKHKVGKPIFGKEFVIDVTDYGTKLATWKAKSGKTINNKATPGKSYNVNGGFGHTPPGWWRTKRRTDFTYPQPDQSSGTGTKKKIKQGAYVRWKQDDEIASSNRYTNLYRYDAAKLHDAAIGEPTTIRFKFDMIPIEPGTAQGRTDIQIHPDGECTDEIMGGTAGCIGIQTYKDCLQVDGVLQRFNGLKVKVQLK